jgi:uncharacterized protein
LILLSSWGFSQPKKEYHDAAQTQLKSETDYLKGMPHGTHLEYYKSGRVSRKGFFNYGKEDSVWTFYYEDGKKKAIENYVKGKKWGTNKYYFKSGKIAQVTKYENDLSDSVWTAYYENGNVKSKETFELGKKEGEWIYYYENGQIESRGFFEKDQYNGKVKITATELLVGFGKNIMKTDKKNLTRNTRILYFY